MPDEITLKTIQNKNFYHVVLFISIVYVYNFVLFLIQVHMARALTRIARRVVTRSPVRRAWMAAGVISAL